MDRRVSYRMDKVNAEMQKVVSSVINAELRNPQIDDAVITVTEVQTSPDFSSAKVYVSALNTSLAHEDVLKELAEAEGFIKRRIAEELKMKRTPALRFIYDDSQEHGDKILKMLESLKK